MDVPPPPPASAPPGPAAVPAPAGPSRASAAAFLFVPLALWPAFLVVTGWMDGDPRMLALGVAGLVAAGVPAVAALAGAGWAAVAAEVVCYGGMAGALVSILSSGVQWRTAPAAAYFVLYAFLSHRRLKAPKPVAAAEGRPAEPPPPEHPLEWLKENLEAIVVAFVMALVIRCFCIEVFKIPSSSMETTLLGDSPPEGRTGDRIMVTKYYFALDPVQRYDVVVFKFPLNPTRNFIKRVTGLPGEDLCIFRGNLYAAPTGSGREFELQRKPLRVQRSIWQDAWPSVPDVLQDRATFDKCFTIDGSDSGIRVADGALRNNASSPTSRFRAERIADLDGTRITEVLWDGELLLGEGAGTFDVEIRHDWGNFRLRLGGPDPAIEWGERKVPLAGAEFAPGRPRRVEFFVADGAAVALLDGKVAAELVFQTLWDKEDRDETDGLSFGSTNRQFQVSKLRIGRDVHYKSKDGPSDPRALRRSKPLSIPKGSYFMMGDNVCRSHDSRAWTKHTVTLKSGEKISCEGQTWDGRWEAKRRWESRTGRTDADYVIEADLRGWERPIRDEDLDPNAKDEPEIAPFVDEKYLVGKALWVWWPPPGWFRLIR